MKKHKWRSRLYLCGLLLLSIMMTGANICLADSWWAPKLGMPTDADINKAWQAGLPILQQEFGRSGESYSISDLQFKKWHDPKVSDPVQASAVVATLTLTHTYPLDGGGTKTDVLYGFCRLNSIGSVWNFGSFNWTNPLIVTYQGPFPIEKNFGSAKERDDYLANVYFKGCLPGFPGEETAPPWTTVAGGMAEVIAAAAAIAAVLKKISKSSPKNDPEPPPRYILQLSTREVQVGVNQPGTLKVTAWRVDPSGTPLAAPEAAIQIMVPTTPAGISITPTTGQGELRCSISIAAQPTASAPITISVIASSNGVQTTATVTVSVGLQELVLGAWVNGQKNQDVVFLNNSAGAGWNFADIIAYFHTPGEPDKPVMPSFKYGFPSPPIQVDPPVLGVADSNEDHPGYFRIKVGLAADLEQYLGQDLADRDGIINVTVTAANRDTGQPFTATVAYRIRPQLELFAHGWVDPKQHIYKNLNLDGLEFVADGDDQLGVAIACCRTDKPGIREIGQVDLVIPDWWTWDWKLQGDAQPGFDYLQPKDIPEGGHELTVFSQKPLLFTNDRANKKLVLHLEADLANSAPPNYLPKHLTLDKDLKARYPDLRLWAIPGKQRGTSEVWMYVFLDRDTQQPLDAQTVRIDIDSPSSATLSPAGDPSMATCQTGENGSAQLDLFYAGLNWGNFREAQYTVSGTLQSKDEKLSDPVKKEIDIAGNVSKLLADIHRNRIELKLDNPCFESESFAGAVQTVAPLVAMTVFYSRPFLRGMLWNTIIAVSGHDNEAANNRFYRDYVCSSMRNRIAKWLCHRRNYQAGMPYNIERVESMNGIEFEDFCFEDVHVWEALFLAGMEPLDDPRGLDPWWQQNWQNEAYLDPDGLLSKRHERYYMLELDLWLTAIGIPSFIVLVSSLLSTLGLTIIVAIDIVVSLYMKYRAIFALNVGPDFRYDPQKGYRYTDLMEGISESRALFPYLGRDKFLKDWIEDNPQG